MSQNGNGRHKAGKHGCTGTNKDGTTCDGHAVKGTTRCRRHPVTPNVPARDEAWSRDAFLAAFEHCGLVTMACRLVDVGRTTVYEERQRNEDFAVAWADVEERLVERMEGEAYRRAVEGVQKPMVSAGKMVTTVTEYSDGLLTFLLKARRPEVYRERVDVNNNHSGGVKVEHQIDLSKLDTSDLEQLERITAKLEA